MLEPEEVFMGTKAIEQMKRLRLIIIRNIHISGCLEYLSNEIRWLDVHRNNLPATVEGNGPAQPSILASGPNKPAENEKHCGQIRTNLFKFRCKGAASRNCRIDCGDALSDFKCIMASPHKLAQFLCCRRRKGYSHNNGEADSDSDLLLEEYSVFKKFSEAELVRATSNFSNDNKIGVGSAGTVYRRTLDDGQEVAIKWRYVTRKSFEGVEFITEIKILRHVNHKNLIRLLGYHARHRECTLVYEYINNSSLYYHLHTIGSSTLMSWNARLKVALDVARGIEYLHEFASLRIVLRDIKSSNILLDEKWTAKVSDFGLSRILPEDEVSDFSDPAAGTTGYIAPECFSSHRLTSKSDVYGYGIVLLELLSGRKAFQRDEDGPLSHITEVVVPRIVEGEIGKALDPNMPIPATSEMVAVEYMAYLTVDCVQIEAGNRPSMTDAVDCLRSALAQCSST